MSSEVFLPDYAERCSGVGDGSRTHDLLNAIQALSQLSYGPTYVTTLLSYRCCSKSQVEHGDGVCQAIVGKNLNLPISWKFK